MTDAGNALDREGFVALRGVLDVQRDIAPLQRELGRLIQRCAGVHGIAHAPPDDPAAFDRGYVDLVAREPAIQPLVYDNAKALPAFHRLVAHPLLVELFEQARHTSRCGTALGTSGIRIDRPGDEKHLAPWHQEFPYQFRSLDAITFWLPLVPVDALAGPVVLARGSHRDGIVPLVDAAGTADDDMRRGEYGNWQLSDEAERLARYEHVSVETVPGDLLAFDFLTLHASTPNRGQRARWTVQIRYFNFDDPYGTSIRWAGGIKHGKTFAEMNASLEHAAAFRPGSLA